MTSVFLTKVISNVPIIQLQTASYSNENRNVTPEPRCDTHPLVIKKRTKILYLMDYEV